MDVRHSSHYDAFGEVLGWVSVFAIRVWAAAAPLLASRSTWPLWRTWLLSLVAVGTVGAVAGAAVPSFYAPVETWANFVLLLYAPVSAATTATAARLGRSRPLAARLFAALAVAAVLLLVGIVTEILVVPFSEYGPARYW